MLSYSANINTLTAFGSAFLNCISKRRFPLFISDKCPELLQSSAKSGLKLNPKNVYPSAYVSLSMIHLALQNNWLDVANNARYSRMYWFPPKSGLYGFDGY